MLYEDITSQVIGAFFNVYNKLGYGFLEKVYENAMVLELQKSNLKVEQQQKIKVYYDGKVVGEYYADLVIEDKIIIELKAAEGICAEHEAQLINYLKATNKQVGLLINFGKKPEFKRKIYENHLK